MDDQSFTHLAKPNTGDYYEGNGAYMRAIYPRPYVTRATLPGGEGRELVFREDSYDPTTRVRRGRFYQITMTFALTWDRVRFEPYLRPSATSINGTGAANFQFVAEQTSGLAALLNRLHGYDIRLGRSPAQTTWKIIDAEGLADGGVLYALRSRSSFGLLPPLKDDAGDLITRAYQNVVERGLRSDADAVVDGCRESCARVLGSYFGIVGEDLADIAKQVEKRPQAPFALVNAAHLLGRFHSRTKASVHGRQALRGHKLREIAEDDALLAIRLFGFVLQDLGYAEA